MLERHQMGAMVLHQPGQALRYEERACPPPGLGQIRVRVEACAVCRTDLHVVDGELPNQKLPIVPGHEVVGIVEMVGEGVADIAVGTRVGIAWLAHTCGDCSYCRSGRENLCDFAAFTGYTRDGGFASHVIAEGAYVFPLPKDADATKLAPLMCAGMIGWRCLRALGAAQEVGLYGFGAAAHLVAQVLRWEGRAFHAFTRPGRARPGIGAILGCSLGRRFGYCSSYVFGRRHRFRARWVSRADGAQRYSQRRPSGVRRHPYDGYSAYAIPTALGRKRACLRGESYAT
ncbi:L-threonine 3-dehydrogenase [Castellaniella defragrans]